MLPQWLLGAPYSTFFTLALASAVSLATTLLNRKFVNREQASAWQREINKWNTEKNLAKKTGDKKLLAKVKKQEARILQLQSKMFSQQMKTSLVTFVPLIIIWQVLIGFFRDTAVARLPGFFGGPPLDIPFFYWYMISSIFIGTLVSRMFGVGMGMGMGLGTSTSETR